MRSHGIITDSDSPSVPSVTPSEAAGLDREFAAKIRERCSSDDLEINGCELDRIILDLIHRLGMTETVEAFNAVDCWRA